MRESARRIVLELAIVLGVLLVAVAHAITLTPKAQTWLLAVATFGQAIACFACGIHLMGARATGWLLGLSVVMGWCWEQVGVATGIPFGPYHYTDLLGPRIGLVPVTIPFAWFVVVFMTIVITNLMIDGRAVTGGSTPRLAWLCLVGGFVTAAFDLPADPFMVDTAHAWVMENRGPFFGEQFRGFAGWVVVSFTISLAFRLAHRRLGAPANPEAPARAAAVPVLLYAAWGAFFAVVDHPPGVRVVAVFAMAIPVLVALTRLFDARRRTA